MLGITTEEIEISALVCASTNNITHPFGNVPVGKVWLKGLLQSNSKILLTKRVAANINRLLHSIYLKFAFFNFNFLTILHKYHLSSIRNFTADVTFSLQLL